jgi:hypothetical protein
MPFFAVCIAAILSCPQIGMLKILEQPPMSGTVSVFRGLEIRTLQASAVHIMKAPVASQLNVTEAGHNRSLTTDVLFIAALEDFFKFCFDNFPEKEWI